MKRILTWLFAVTMTILGQPVLVMRLDRKSHRMYFSASPGLSIEDTIQVAFKKMFMSQNPPSFTEPRSEGWKAK